MAQFGRAGALGASGCRFKSCHSDFSCQFLHFMHNVVMNCAMCFGDIEYERLEAVPNTQVCIACAQKYNVGKKKKGYMSYGHKTGAEIQIMSDACFKSQKKYIFANGARSAVKNFSRSICA